MTHEISETYSPSQTSGYGKFFEDAYAFGKSANSFDSKNSTNELPNVEIADNEEGGLANVVSNVGYGMADELTDNFGNVLTHAVVGIGAAAMFAMLSPVAATVAFVGAAAWGAYELTGALPGWWHDASIAYDPESHSESEVKQAEDGLRDLGAGTVDFVAAGVAAPVGSNIGRTLAPAVRPAAENLAAAASRGAGQLGEFASKSFENIVGPATRDALQQPIARAGEVAGKVREPLRNFWDDRIANA